jgi:hypothetical protein
MCTNYHHHQFNTYKFFAVEQSVQSGLSPRFVKVSPVSCPSLSSESDDIAPFPLDLLAKLYCSPFVTSNFLMSPFLQELWKVRKRCWYFLTAIPVLDKVRSDDNTTRKVNKKDCKVKADRRGFVVSQQTHKMGRDVIVYWRRWKLVYPLYCITHPASSMTGNWSKPFSFIMSMASWHVTVGKTDSGASNLRHPTFSLLHL